MPGLAIGFGIILILQGIITYFIAAEGSRSFTALIPSVVGGLLVVCGFLAKKPDLRRHAMHAAAAVAVIGLLGALGRAVPAVLAGKTIGLAIGSQLVMGVLLLIFVILCVRSFIAARRARTV
jgi:hypothetical protein